MSFRLFDAPADEPSRAMGFAGNRVERRSEHRSDDDAQAALADSAARLLVIRAGRLHLAQRQDGSFDPWFTTEASRAFDPAFPEAVLLGWHNDAPMLAVPGGLDPEALPEGVKAIEYRSVLVQGLIDAADLGALAQGAALLAWHISHRFCGRCGGATEMRAGGYKRVCLACSAEHFPRTDPVAIMLAVSGHKCLLGRGAHFAPGVFSSLAGFIEPGETIEDAVRRETYEEAGIRLGRVVYHASQPWPFPYSLMIGCFGEALNEEVVADAGELEACRWFPRQEVWAMIESRHPDGLKVPPPTAIAHHLIKAWAES